MLKTYELEMDQRSKRHGRKSRTVALNAEEESSKVVVSKKGKGKALIIKSDSESSSSDDDDSETESLLEVDADEEMMKLCALMVKGITKIVYRKFRRGKKFSRNGRSSDKKSFRKSEGKGGKSDRGDYSNVKCYNCGKKCHISPDCKKGKIDKGKALITKKKSWTYTSDSEEEENYVLMANADSSSNAAELKVNPVKFVAKTVKSDSEKMKDIETEVIAESTSDKLEQDKPTEVNIGLMTKKQIKHKLKEVTSVNKVKVARKNRNGKEGVNKSNNYMPVHNAPRKKCYNCGNSNHVASFYRKNKNINSLPSKSGVKSQSVRFKPLNPCFHCGSTWHSIYTCKEYHSLYYDYYQIKPSLKKVALIPSSIKYDAKSYTVNTDKKIVNINSDVKSAGNMKNILVLDSGCSGHMTENKALLPDFVEKASPEVSYGDGNIGKTLGYGKINLGNVIIEKKEKQRKSSFKSKSESSILEPYHLLHVDLFGPVNVMSFVKKKYAMVIVDGFTRFKCWIIKNVSFMNTKGVKKMSSNDELAAMVGRRKVDNVDEGG
ncbi:hypothetical protein AgCh_039101 [Apium graveolens]